MIPRILKGNDFQLTINVNNKSEDSAFNIAGAETITIYIIGANKSKYEFTNYTIKDNVISGTCTYILTPQYYNVEILLYKDKVHYRSYQVGQFQVVSNNSQAGLSSNIEFDTDKVVNVYCEFGSGTEVSRSYVDSELATKLNITDYKAADVTKSYVDSQLSGKQDKGNYLTAVPDEYITETELSSKGYAINEDLKNANSSISDISTRLNGKQDKGNYLTSIPSEYITESELNSKGYLTEHQSLTNYATVNDLTSANSSISDISTRLSTIHGDVTKSYVDDISTRLSADIINLSSTNSSISDISTRLQTKLDKSSYVAPDVTKSYVDSELEKKQNVGNYLTSIPSEYITESELNSKGYLTEHQSLTNYATVSELSSTNSSISDISTRINEKQDKGNYLTSIPSEYITESELNSKGYLTEHQSLTNYATVSELTSANSSISDISTRLLTKLDKSSYVAPTVDKTYVDSELEKKQNVGNYLTSVPDEYITESELNSKGYLTEHQSLTNYATVSELTSANSSISDISTRINEKQDKGNYLTSIPEEYITETELNSKGYLTEHQSLTNYATVSDLKNSNSSISDISTRVKSNSDNINLKLNVADYISPDVTKSYVDTQLSTKQDKGNYLTSVPDEYITESELTAKGYLTEHQSLINYATNSDLHTTNSSISDISTRLSNVKEFTLSDVISRGTGEQSLIFNVLSSNKATGKYSHAEGKDTTASGDYSHAEGGYAELNPDVMGVESSGLCSHAEGTGTISIGVCSHAEGIETESKGSYSHAEGTGTYSNGESSHAEGNVTYSNGDYSHAEGWNTYSNGESSHAEGIYTNANGSYSHAEGTGTKANNNSEHSSGQYNISNTDVSTKFGLYGNTLFSIGNGTSDTVRKNAFEIRQDGSIFVQGISGTVQNYISDISTRLNTDINNLSVVNSSISDISTRLSNIHGDVTLSYVDDISTRLTTDINNLSFVNSSISDISTRLQTKLDKSSYVAADVTKSYVDTQLATKQNSGNYLTSDSLTPVNSSISDISTRLSKVYGGVTQNYVDDISTRLSTDITNLSVANTSISNISSKLTAIWSNGTSIIENYINNYCDNAKNYQHAEGQYTTAKKSCSHAEGYYTQALQAYAHAEGNYTIAQYSAHAEGQHTTAQGEISHTEGYYTIAYNQSEHASGQYNVSNRASSTFGNSANTLFTVGNGSSDTDRKNALEIRQDGTTIIKGTLTCTSLSQTSDLRLKDNIKDINNETINKIRNIKLKEFNFKSDKKVKKYGVIAQDLQSYGLSDLVVKNGDYLSVDYTSFLTLKIEELEKRITTLESK